MLVLADERIFERFKELSKRTQLDLRWARGIIQNDMEIRSGEVVEWITSMNNLKSRFNREIDLIVQDIETHLENCQRVERE